MGNSQVSVFSGVSLAARHHEKTGDVSIAVYPCNEMPFTSKASCYRREHAAVMFNNKTRTAFQIVRVGW